MDVDVARYDLSPAQPFGLEVQPASCVTASDVVCLTLLTAVRNRSKRRRTDRPTAVLPVLLSRAMFIIASW